MIKAVLFDLDGTVLNTNELIIESWKHTLLKHMGSFPGRDEIIMHFGEPFMRTAMRFDEKNPEAICATYRKIYDEIHDSMIQGYDGMEDALTQLKNMGIKIGIVTSKRRETTERGLRLFNLYDLMDVIVTVEDTERHKPHKDPLLKAIGILGVSPDEVIYVGDSQYDILCGKDAKAATCIVRYTVLPFEELLKYNPDFIIDRPGDIIDIAASSYVKAV